MGKKKVEYFCRTVKKFIFLQQCGNFQAMVKATDSEIGSAVAKFQSDDDISLKSRMTEIERKSRQQDREMFHLKTRAEEDRKVINRLQDRVSMLEASVVNLKPKADGKFQRQKRPFRLLPPHQSNIGAVDKVPDDSLVSNPPFYGPPTSCSDLGKLGYTLNGYYMVKRNSNSNFGKIATVFCSFKQKQKDPSLETFIGYVEIKTKSVHFFVQRKSVLIQNGIVIPFEINRLNVGGAMNLTTGIFTAPVAGIYHFQFSGRKDASKGGYLSVYLQVNGKEISYTSVGIFGSFNNNDGLTFSEIHDTLQLKKGDRVYLLKRGPAGLADYNEYPITHFTGSLLEEYLELA